MLMLILYVLGFPFMYGFLLIEMFKSADEVSLLTLIATLFVGFIGAFFLAKHTSSPVCREC